MAKTLYEDRQHRYSFFEEPAFDERAELAFRLLVTLPDEVILFESRFLLTPLEELAKREVLRFDAVRILLPFGPRLEETFFGEDGLPVRSKQVR